MTIYTNSPEVRLTNFIINNISDSFKGIDFQFDTDSVKPFSSALVYKSDADVVVMVGQMINEYAIMSGDYAIQDIIEDVVTIINNGILNGWDEI